MKHAYLNQKLFTITLILISLCWNGTMVDTGNKKDKLPDVNVYGELEDHNSTSKVEYILIGGLYEKIPVYQTIEGAPKTTEKQKDSTPLIDPKQNKIFLDLHEISSIALKHPERPIEFELDINNRKYVEIDVTTINGSTKTYLIESSREISCIKIDKGPDNDKKPINEERKLNAIHVRKLLIKGYKSGKDAVHQDNRDASVSDKSKIAESTEKILDQIEEKVNNLPKEDPSNYEKIKESLIALLRSLRDQLQKMLNLIKN